MAVKSLINLNHHLLCAIDVETTGLDPNYNEVIQLALIPLDQNLEVSKRHSFFEQKIRIMYPDRVDPMAMTVSKPQLDDIALNGLAPETVIDLFDGWFERLKLPHGKKIVPLAHNWPFDSAFLKVFFGPKGFDNYFFGYYRDTLCAANFLNDWSDFHAEQFPYPKLKLSNMATNLKIDFDHAQLHDALMDAHLTAQVYRRMILGHTVL